MQNQMYQPKGRGGYMGGGLPMSFGSFNQGIKTGPPHPKKDFSQYYSLYVGNLSNKTFDLDLYKFFESRGYKLAGAKVMFDRETF